MRSLALVATVVASILAHLAPASFAATTGSDGHRVVDVHVASAMQDPPAPPAPTPDVPPAVPVPAPPGSEPGAEPSPTSGPSPAEGPAAAPPVTAPPTDRNPLLDRPMPPAAPLVGGHKRRVHIIEDRFREWGGPVEAEDPDYVVIDSRGKLRGFYKSRVIAVIPLVDPDPGQPGVVTMRDGRQYRGIVIEDAYDYVELSIEGIRQRFPRASVMRTILVLTPRQAYEQAKREIPADQYSARMVLARYLFDNKMYAEAREELLSLIEAVDLHDAKELLRTVEAQIALAQPAPTSGVGAGEAGEFATDETEVGERGPVTLRDTLPARVLSPEDVNLIRVFELDFNRPPRVTISPELIREMIERYASSAMIPASSEGRTALFREDPIKLVRLLFDLRARELYPKIQVDTEPYSLNLFRQRVHNAWLINNCATSQCHGGVDAGRLFLHNRNAKSEQVRYTNLLLLDRTKLQGLPPLIDWERPLDSLIIQYGLPRTEARFPHPPVKGWKPVFNAANRRLLDDFERWVRAMYRPRPEYPIDFEPPFLDAPDTPSSPDTDRSRIPR